MYVSCQPAFVDLMPAHRPNVSLELIAIHIYKIMQVQRAHCRQDYEELLNPTINGFLKVNDKDDYIHTSKSTGCSYILTNITLI
jgi:hypothetical protein